MGISKIDKESAENGTVVKIEGLKVIFKRHSNSEELLVSVCEFTQKKINPEIGKVYRYSVFRGSSGKIKITNIRPVLYLSNKSRIRVCSFEDHFAERDLKANGVIEWFDWEKGYGAVLLSDDSTAFVHISLVREVLQEFGFPCGAQLMGQTVHVVVIPDPEKDLRVTRIEFVD